MGTASSHGHAKQNSGWSKTLHANERWSMQESRGPCIFHNTLAEILTCIYNGCLNLEFVGHWKKSVDQMWMQSKLKNNLRGFIVLMIQSIREEIWKAGTKCSSHPFINDSALQQFFSHAAGSSAAVPVSHTHTEAHTTWLLHLQLIGWIVLCLLPFLKVTFRNGCTKKKLFFFFCGVVFKSEFLMHGCSIFSCCFSSDSKLKLKYCYVVSMALHLSPPLPVNFILSL